MLIGYFVTLCLLSIAIILIKLSSSIFSPSCFFACIWTILSLVVINPPYGMYNVHFETWVIIFIGTISFIMGSMLGERVKIKAKSKNSSDMLGLIEKEKFLFSDRTLTKICLFILIYNIKDMLRVTTILSQGYDYGFVRMSYFGGVDDQNLNRGGMILNVLIGALSTIAISSSLQYYFARPKHNLKYLLFSSLIVIENVLISGGRVGIVYYVLQFIIISVIFRKFRNSSENENTKNIKKQKRAIRILIIICIAIGWVMTNARGFKNEMIFRSLVLYFSGGVVNMDRRLDFLHGKEMTFSFSGFHAIWSILLSLSRLIGFSYPEAYDTSSYIIAQLHENTLIGYDMDMNAFVSVFYLPYADFRYFGVVIEIFIFGLIIGTLYKASIINPTNGYFTAYLILFKYIFMSMVRYPFADISLVLPLLIVLIICFFSNVNIRFGHVE